jgi:hypothetical protein
MSFGRVGRTLLDNAAEAAGLSVSGFIAEDPANLLPPARAIQTGARLSCDVWANVPSTIAGASAFPGTLMNEACGGYYGNEGYDAPAFSSGKNAQGYYLDPLGATFGEAGKNYLVDWYNYQSQAVVIGTGPECGPFTVTQVGFEIRLAACDGSRVIQLIELGQRRGSIIKIYEAVSGDEVPLPTGWEPGNNLPDEPTTTTPVPTGDGWDLDVGIPIINLSANGELNVTVDIGGVTVDLSGDPTNPTPPTPPQIGDPVDTSTDEEVEADEGFCIIAAQCDVTTPFTGGSIVPLAGGEVLTIPRHGNIVFSDAEGFSLNAQDVRLSQQIVVPPSGICWKKAVSSPTPGVEWSVSIVQVPEEELNR